MLMLAYDFMQRALVAALVLGLVAPLVGAFLVQRRLALLGDGMGHVALTGVGLAFLVNSAPIATALLVTVCGAILLEVVRAKSRTAGDLALALLFYGGIAGGVLFTSLAPGQGSAALNQYLFGSLATVSPSDITALVGASFLVCLVLTLGGKRMFLVALDHDLAHTQGVNVRRVSAVLTILTAVTVVVGMRTVGLLLVSAVMVVPIAAAQQLTSSFRGTALIGSFIGVACCVSGLVISYWIDAPPGAAIVLLALGVFAMTAVSRGIRDHALRANISSVNDAA
jgi:zinc transport system permease protein